ncbi:MAG: hypothetical protein AAF577_10310 [Pseudomonadota bacterium]
MSRSLSSPVHPVRLTRSRGRSQGAFIASVLIGALVPVAAGGATIPLSAAVAADAACLGCTSTQVASVVRDLPVAVIPAEIALAADPPRGLSFERHTFMPGEGPLAAMLYLGIALAFMGLASYRAR